MRKIVQVMFLLLSGQMAWANVSLHSVKRYFEISNINEYPGYQFYFHYQTYPYHSSYQKGPMVRMEVGQDLPYSTSDFYDGAYLEAVDSLGHHYRSNITVGGRLVTIDPHLDRVEDIYRIGFIEKGVIHLQLVTEIAPSPDGSIHESTGGVPGFVISPGSAGRMTMFIAPLLFGSVVALLIIMRSRMVKRISH